MIRYTRKAVSVAGTVSHTIAATAGSGGNITPSGSITVASGGNQTFTITPSTLTSVSKSPRTGSTRNGYLRFTMEYAGDIITSEGPLERM